MVVLGEVTSIHHDTGMCHYFGYFFRVLPDFGVSFWLIPGFWVSFFVRLVFIWNDPDFGY